MQIVTADVRDRVGIRAAIAGTTTEISAVHGFAGPGKVSPEGVDHRGNVNLIDAAAELGVDVLLMSVVGASPDHPVELLRAKHAAEQHLINSGAAWTIVRATAFVELWAEIMRKSIGFGRGENRSTSVSVDDVATAVDRAVLHDDQRGRVIQVGGPRNLSFIELAASLQRARGKSGNVRHVPRQAFRVAARFSRQARAAIAMDTIDMTFTPQPPRPYQPLTDPWTSSNTVPREPRAEVALRLSPALAYEPGCTPARAPTPASCSQEHLDRSAWHLQSAELGHRGTALVMPD